MELFARDLSSALGDRVELRLVKWGGHGRKKAVLIALPYLFLRSFWALLVGNFDVIHVQDGLLAPMGRVLSFIFRKPYVVVIHGLDITYTNPLFKAMVPATVARASAVICISQAAATEAIRRGVPGTKIQVIPLAVNDDVHGLASQTELLDYLDLSDNYQVLLTVGRLVKRKGVVWFIENVLPGLVEKFPKLVYLVAGEGQERPNIEAAVARTKTEKYVRLLGKTSPELLAAAYNGADVFVMPNIKVPGDVEGFGLVLLEAAVCARPVVAANLEGIKDAVVDGQNGVLVPPGNAIRFNDAVSFFLDDPAAAKQFGAQARQFTLDNYSWTKIADRYLEVYSRLH